MRLGQPVRLWRNDADARKVRRYIAAATRANRSRSGADREAARQAAIVPFVRKGAIALAERSRERHVAQPGQVIPQ